VQSSVWAELAGGSSTAHDLCVAAPTGSGKTLAYALPVVNQLARYGVVTAVQCATHAV
jgi:ATP-dependent RNA helicase DDX51/DBP6